MSHTPLDFADYDYDNMVTQLQNIVKNRSTWVDLYASGTGQMLIELWSYLSEMMMYYAERRAQESYLDTAQLRSSVVNLVKILNYQPSRNVSSTGNVRLYLEVNGSPSTWPNNIFILRYTNLVSTGGVKFMTNEEVVLAAGTSQVIAAAIQGELVTENFTADGTVNQEFPIADILVENTEITVRVDGILWSEVASFVESEGGDEVYKLELNLNGSVTVIFGDNQFGKAPPDTKAVLVQYVRSNGATGNIFSSTGIITTLSDTIVDELAVTVDTIKVDNSSKFLTGADAEGIEDIRFNAPRVFATGDRAVTRADYIAILENFPGVVSANVFGENELTPPDITKFNLVRILLVLASYAFPDTALKTILSAFLLTKAQLTVHYEFVDPDICDVVVIDTAVVTSDQSLTVMKTAIETELDAQFQLGTIGIADPVRFSDVDRAIDALVGVDYHHLLFRPQDTIGTGDASTLNFAATLCLLPEENTVDVYEGSTLVASDDGLGAFVAVGGSGVTGTVNYETGVVDVTFTTPPASAETVKVRYKQDNGAGTFDLVVDKDQIIRLSAKEVTASY